jgi:asparagine synthase (glutamine-hydrolysing)
MAQAVVVSRRAPVETDDVLRMLRAASPERAAAQRVEVRGNAAFGVANDPAFADTWLAVDDGRMALFEGTLDNESELRAELGQPGRPAPQDLAALVLAAVEAWGDAAPARFRGNFAGACWGGHTLTCFNDQLGLRPLFFRDDDGRFVVASEAKQVPPGARIRREPDVDVVEDIFYGRPQPGATALKGVSRFPRASIARVEGSDRAEFRRYWDPDGLLETARLGVDEASERLTELLEQAVHRTITGNDVAELSGGIDSTTIAALAAPRHVELSGKSLTALTHVYPDQPTVDEQKYAQLVSDALGLAFHTYVPQARPLDRLEHWVDVLDGPTNVLAIPSIVEGLEHARLLGSRTVLSGEMAEFVYTMREHLIGHLLLRGRLRPAARWVRQRRERGHRWQTILRQTVRSVAPPRVAERWFALRRRREQAIAPWIVSSGKRSVLSSDLRRPARRRWELGQLLPIKSDVTGFESLELCAAACGVHLRLPLADVDLWEFFLSLRAETKFPDLVSKSLVRRAMRGRVPDAILDRKDKTAFDAHALATADYDGLRRYVLESEQRLAGIDYRLLAERVERRNMSLFELVWAYDLARAHAFLDLWR